MPFHKLLIHTHLLLPSHVCRKPECRPYHQMCDFRGKRVRMIVQTNLIVSCRPGQWCENRSGYAGRCKGIGNVLSAGPASAIFRPGRISRWKSTISGFFVSRQSISPNQTATDERSLLFQNLTLVPSSRVGARTDDFIHVVPGEGLR